MVLEFATALGTIGAVIYVLIKEILVVWLRRPKFSLSVGTSNPLLTHAYVSNQCKGFCYHIQVINIGRSTAKKCEAELSEIWTEHHEHKGKFRERKNYIPTELHWALNGRSMNIYRKGKKYIDLGYIVDHTNSPNTLGFHDINSLKIYFAIGNMPFGVVSELESGLKHRVKITLLGDNFNPLTDQWFEIYIPLTCHDPNQSLGHVSSQSYVSISNKPSGLEVFKQ